MPPVSSCAPSVGEQVHNTSSQQQKGVCAMKRTKNASVRQRGELYFTVEEAADRLLCAPRTIRKYCQLGVLRSVRLGSLIRIPESALRPDRLSAEHMNTFQARDK
jgi:excisionase family DNA binding protein